MTNRLADRPQDTEDKEAWCLAALEEERDFVENRLPVLGLRGEMNPEKQYNKYAHDIFVCGWPADLKSQKTPFFTAEKNFGLNPQYAVSFNRKDGKKYKEECPNIMVFFDVHWIETRMEIGGSVYEVVPMHVTYAGLLQSVYRAIEADGLQRHAYGRRVDDTSGNAKESYVFDVRRLHKLNPL